MPRFRKALERFPGYGPKEDAMLYLGFSQIHNGDLEEGTTFKWYQADSADGANASVIIGEINDI